jgi:hypothetical protein
LVVEKIRYEKGWYYMSEGNSSNGPFSNDEFLELFENNIVDENTSCFKHGLVKKWVSFSTIEFELRDLTAYE